MSDTSGSDRQSGEQLAEMIAKAQTGDRFAIGWLFVRHYDLLAARIRRTIPNHLAHNLEVDDLVQQTYITAFRCLPKFEFRSDESWRSWLGLIAERQTLNVIDHFQRRGQRLQGHALAESGADSSHGPPRSGPVDPCETPQRWAATQEAVQAIQSALDLLPQDQKTAILLHYLGAHSVGDTALTMGRTAGAVRGLLQRARHSLQVVLGRSSRWFDKNH